MSDTQNVPGTDVAAENTAETPAPETTTSQREPTQAAEPTQDAVKSA